MKVLVKPTLTQVLTGCFLGLILLLVVLFYEVLQRSGESILQAADRNREESSSQIARQVSQYLSQAELTLNSFENWTKTAKAKARDSESIRTALYFLLLANRRLTELTFIYGDESGFNADGTVRLNPSGRGQLTVFRDRKSGHKEEVILARHIRQEGGKFVSYLSEQSATKAFEYGETTREVGAVLPDPTEHLTFITPSSRDFRGAPLWSDLHWSELDESMPQEQRQVRVSIQKALIDSNGKLLGVLRVGLATGEIDRLVRLNLAPNENHPKLVFICDDRGQLITRINRADTFKSIDGDLRVVPKFLPTEISRALSLVRDSGISPEKPIISGGFESDGERYLASFRALGEAQNWNVGIVAPESFYLGDLVEIRNRLLLVAILMIAGIVIAGSVLVRSIRKAQRQIVVETKKMNEFDFAPAQYISSFSDIEAALEGLERAKTAMRAMSKYAPIDLVRRLYQQKKDPILGAEALEISLMFTDIEDFTKISESLSPNKLAEALGLYLEVMVEIIQDKTNGTIDKFIGDAIMAMWNAPAPTKGHSLLACQAALECLEAGRQLSSSQRWQGLPPFKTRFGLHKETVMVGHFGAPTRMNFTAVGDGVNLASRLEALNKRYGTSVIASQTIQRDATHVFEFRLLDRVAVAGKTNGIEVYELLGRCGEVSQDKLNWAKVYQQAFEAYSNRDFSGVVAFLQRQQEDLPSRLLSTRARSYIVNPPSEDWDGIYYAAEK